MLYKSKQFLLFGLIMSLIFLNSCQKNNLNDSIVSIQNLKKDIDVKNDRLVFNNSKILVESLNQLAEMSTSEIENWKEMYNLSSTHPEIVLTNSVLPPAFKHIFNDKLEFQVADSIVWYNNEREYVITNGDESLLEEVKRSVLGGIVEPNFENLFVLKLEQHEHSEEVTSRTLCRFPLRDSRHQKEFEGTNHVFKWVYTMVYFKETFTGSVQLETKLEYRRKNRRRWRLAGEIVTSNVNVNAVTVFSNGTSRTDSFVTFRVSPGGTGNMTRFYSNSSCISRITYTGSIDVSGTVPVNIQSSFSRSGTLWNFFL